MPVYEFRCEECKSKFDVFTPTRMSTEGTICRNCHSAKVRRLVSTFAAIGGDSDGEMSMAGDAPQATGGGCCGGCCGCGH